MRLQIQHISTSSDHLLSATSEPYIAKIYTPAGSDVRDRFYYECKILVTPSHPYILPPIDVANLDTPPTRASLHFPDSVQGCRELPRGPAFQLSSQIKSLLDELCAATSHFHARALSQLLSNNIHPEWRRTSPATFNVTTAPWQTMSIHALDLVGDALFNPGMFNNYYWVDAQLASGATVTLLCHPRVIIRNNIFVSTATTEGVECSLTWTHTTTAPTWEEYASMTKIVLTYDAAQRTTPIV